MKVIPTGAPGFAKRLPREVEGPAVYELLRLDDVQQVTRTLHRNDE